MVGLEGGLVLLVKLNRTTIIIYRNTNLKFKSKVNKLFFVFQILVLGTLSRQKFQVIILFVSF